MLWMFYEAVQIIIADFRCLLTDKTEDDDRRTKTNDKKTNDINKNIQEMIHKIRKIHLQTAIVVVRHKPIDRIRDRAAYSISRLRSQRSERGTETARVRTKVPRGDERKRENKPERESLKRVS